jgi:hypothetical protein
MKGPVQMVIRCNNEIRPKRIGIGNGEIIAGTV